MLLNRVGGSHGKAWLHVICGWTYHIILPRLDDGDVTGTLQRSGFVLLTKTGEQSFSSRRLQVFSNPAMSDSANDRRARCVPPRMSRRFGRPEQMQR